MAGRFRGSGRTRGNRGPRAASRLQSGSAARRASLVRSATDRNGRTVGVGTRVRVLEVTQALRESVSPDEWDELQTMVGQVFEVYEIDEYDSAWVEKQWLTENGEYSHGHFLALDPHEMEVV